MSVRSHIYIAQTELRCFALRFAILNFTFFLKLKVKK